MLFGKKKEGKDFLTLLTENLDISKLGEKLKDKFPNLKRLYNKLFKPKKGFTDFQMGKLVGSAGKEIKADLDVVYHVVKATSGMISNLQMYRDN